MLFYDYPTTRDLVDKTAPSHEFYKRNFIAALSRFNDKRTALQLTNEGIWERLQRPYYNIYPSIAPMLLKLSLSVDTKFIQPPLAVFLIRLPQDPKILNYQWKGTNWHIRSILVGPGVLRSGAKNFEGMILWVNTGELSRGPDGRDYPIHTYINLPMEDGMTVEQSLDALPWDESAFRGMMIPREIRVACTRLACTICLLGNDPELIEPEVLNKDHGKPITEAILERAKRYGKFGWNVGRSIEVVPHIRRGHPALMWTGHGRHIPRIVMRKGSVVHREIVTKLPMGHLQ